jgi:hypothetical protein
MRLASIVLLGAVAIGAFSGAARADDKDFANEADYIARCSVPVAKMSNACVLVLWQQNWLLSLDGGTRCEARNDLVNVAGVSKVIAWLRTHPKAATANDKSGTGAALTALAPCK